MKQTLLLFAYLGLAAGQIINSCPSAEEIEPCACLLGEDERIEMTCERLKSANALVTAVKNMNGYSVTTFTIKHSSIGVFPSEAFNDIDIYSLIITKSNLTKLGDSRNRPPFLGLENSLQHLEIKDSFVYENSSLSDLSLSHLKKLTFIHLEGNHIPTIGNNWFENGPYDIKDLRLVNSSTYVIGSHAFEALEKLQYFSLSSNYISTITRDMFPMPAVFLFSMDLRSNKLESLPANIFSKMPSLEHLLLENNYFTTIDEVAFAPVWSQLEYVFFHGNPLVCDQNIKWMYNYRLPENFGGYCTNPIKLRNKDLRTLTIADLQ